MPKRYSSRAPYTWRVITSIGSTIDEDGEYTAGNNGNQLLSSVIQADDKFEVTVNDVAELDEGELPTRNDSASHVLISEPIRIYFPTTNPFIEEPLGTPQMMEPFYGAPAHHIIKFQVRDQTNFPLSGVAVEEFPEWICTLQPGHSALSHLGGSTTEGDAITNAEGYFTDTWGFSEGAGHGRGYVKKNGYRFTFGTYILDFKNAVPNGAGWYQIKVLHHVVVGSDGNWAIVRWPRPDNISDPTFQQRLCSWPD
jgi:hypothetical protein